MTNEVSNIEIAKKPLRNYLLAGLSVIENSEGFLRGEKCRSLSLAVLSYVSKTEGLDLTKESKRIARGIINLGVEINDHYDTSYFDVPKYKQLRRLVRGDKFSEDQFEQYFVQLRLLERHRPQPGAREKCITYREQTNLVSLAGACAIAFKRPMESFVNLKNIDLQKTAPAWFKSLYHLVMGLQVVDDMVGYRGDNKAQRPSFFTAFGQATLEELNNSRFVRNRFEAMASLYRNYIKLAKDQDPNFAAPIARISEVIYKFLPGLAEFTRRPIIQKTGFRIVSDRDTKET